ncbi:hypothetical protein M0R72_21170 [Candidatus Pacearchaeota archaeon]|jgi:hypothetical protein|nr:hypothetical protein [Candidatus Pacearchaeota archaeon]
MSTTTTNNGYVKLENSEAGFASQTHANLDLIDAASAKIERLGARAPQVGDDSDDGYSIGSRWFYDGKEWACQAATAGAAEWLQIYPATLTPIEEIPNGTRNGTNKTFTLDHTPVGRVAVYYGDENGTVRMAYGTNFTVSGTTITLITFAPNDALGDIFFADYNYVA